MVESGLSFLAAQFILAIFVCSIFGYSCGRKDLALSRWRTRTGDSCFPSGRVRSVDIGSLRCEGVGQRLFHAARANAIPIQVQAGQFAFYRLDLSSHLLTSEPSPFRRSVLKIITNYCSEACCFSQLSKSSWLFSPPVRFHVVVPLAPKLSANDLVFSSHASRFFGLCVPSGATHSICLPSTLSLEAGAPVCCAQIERRFQYQPK
jgi:hypothetical protein